MSFLIIQANFLLWVSIEKRNSWQAAYLNIMKWIILIKKIIFILGLIISISSILWGIQLIHDTYTLASITTDMLKSGNTDLTIEAMAHYSLQSFKTVAIHLGLVIVGVCYVTFLVTRRLNTTQTKVVQDKFPT